MRKALIASLLLLASIVMPLLAAAQSGNEPYLGEIISVPFGFAPKGWALCEGQLLAISQNTALFSLLGTTFGGNGTSTFALPDLRGRTPIGAGQGPGLNNYDLGETGGEETVTLQVSQIPAHTHPVFASSNVASLANPGGNVWAAQSQLLIYSSGNSTTMAPVGSTGGGQPHDNLSPYITINYIIALQGIFPTRPQ